MIAVLLCAAMVSLSTFGQQSTKSNVRISCTPLQTSPIKIVRPTYPELARQAHIEGRVSLNCLIRTDGLVERIEVKKGHPLLIQAATEAVSQWKFKPMVLNGKAVEVETVVNIDFELPKAASKPSVSPSAPVEYSPDSVAQELYQQVVARKPLGIPKGADKAALWPFLSKRLVQKLDTAQTCEDDYLRQHAGEDGKPAFKWVETGLFSGANERAIPAAAVVERTEPQKDGILRVYVRLTYKESFETYGGPPDPAHTFDWHVAAVVISEGRRFVVDNVLLFKDDSTKIASQLTDSFSGCDVHVGPATI
jgi:TonB family protein